MSEDQKSVLLENVQLKDIRENPAALRSVNRKSESYLGLVDSIKANGVLNPIVVRKVHDDKVNATFYSLVDGLHRYTAACDAGLSEIPCNVIEASDAEALTKQVITNVHKVDTRPVEYSRALVRILGYNPTWTAAELAASMSRSPSWINERLGLLKLDEDIAKEVNEGTINLSNAYALAKLPKEEQAEFVDRARTLAPEEFVPMATARAKEIKDARRQGKDANPESFVAVPRLQKISDIKEEIENPTHISALLASQGISDPIEAAKMSLQWALNLDPMTVQARKEKFDAQKKAQAELKEQRKKDREAKKAETLRKELAELETKKSE